MPFTVSLSPRNSVPARVTPRLTPSGRPRTLDTSSSEHADTTVCIPHPQASDICKIILAIILPPLGVFLERGCVRPPSPRSSLPALPLTTSVTWRRLPTFGVRPLGSWPRLDPEIPLADSCLSSSLVTCSRRLQSTSSLPFSATSPVRRRSIFLGWRTSWRSFRSRALPFRFPSSLTGSPVAFDYRRHRARSVYKKICSAFLSFREPSLTATLLVRSFGE